MIPIIHIDQFSGEITELKRGKRTQENMLAVLAQSPMVSTWDMEEYAWLRKGISDMQIAGLIVSVAKPYLWLRYELTDRGREMVKITKTENAAEAL